MKKSKFLRRVSVIALSAVMTASVALAAAACGGGGGGGGNGDGGGVNEEGYRLGTPGASQDPNELTVYIFCNTSDATTNRAICEEWMRKYNKANGTTHTVRVSTIANKETYFGNVDQYYANNQMYDVLYLAPRYVRTYAETGSVLNLADYLDTVSADPNLTGDAAKAANQEVLGQIWKNAISYYSYQRGAAMGENAYTLGQPVSYNKDQNGFYTDAANEEVGIYGLPKDYSNFSTGYNNIFFSDTIKKDITTSRALKERRVQGAYNESSKSVSKDRLYDQSSGQMANGQSIVQYAVTGDYTNPYTGATMHATDGLPAPIINVGVPTRYFPFNFFRYNTYSEALSNGDPLAVLCEAYTEGNGYVVTIPGFPNDVVEIPDSVKTDPNAPYDTKVGHITYTYGEYSAFIWAMTYYLNTFDWYDVNDSEQHGGVKIGGQYKTVFGGEQYEGKTEAAVGTSLYLLPWLYGNDADIIDITNNYCTAMENGKYVGQGANIADPAQWRDVVSHASHQVEKMNLDGDYRTVDVQYGFNSERFLETYGAFLALASDWNGNIGGDTDADNAIGGWELFRQGRSLFYGAGSWDGATRNDSHTDILEFGQMPTPVSENYALYSKIKGANYTMEEYSNGATAKGNGNDAANDGVQRANKADGLRIYSKDEINANQALRQDKWGARMDSVGYAVNGQVSNYTGDHAWKKEAAVSLVMALTIDRESQISLTYAGAQYPNFRDQMEQFVNYQDYGTEGAFKDMITFEGSATTKYYNEDGSVNDAGKAEAEAIWGDYYKIALDMERAASDPDQKGLTVAQFLEGKTAAGAPVNYDSTYASTTLGAFAGSSTTAFLGYAMKVLYMVPMWRSSREINIRMQYGLNAVRDSTMYTYRDTWVADIDARNNLDTMLAYTRGKSIKVGSTAINSGTLDVLVNGGVKRNPTETAQVWETPVVYCLRKAYLCQQKLNDAVNEEEGALYRLQQK